MNLFDAVIQGIIQGLTEFLPVSSSGHLSLYQHFTGNSGEAAGIYSILLHLGTLLAVCIAFYRDIWDMIKEFFAMVKEIFTGKFDKNNMTGARRMIFLLIISLVPLVFFYFISDFYNSLSTDNDIIVEGLCFLLTAALLIISGRCVKTGGTTAENMSWKQALGMGIMQGIAPLPGLSRSGSTISAGLILGVSRDQAVAFSFIMGVPAVLAANILEVPAAVSGEVEINWGAALAGMAVSLIVGIAAIKTVKLLVKNDKFTKFAWYLVPLGVLMVAVGIFEHVTGTTITF
ncbi:MAG: undecaprenyl-diphosphate phosphatase [Oscillospiraceae bacterium]|nr:undecaprenyl-diphosphate phosphatase [Oscillospiraceae bacterium]MBQ2998430.1 undecaprenyl-diphosphate phosphatase [Oscillospiraceae bacterium]MBQ3236945.1 undecaprenyl-diphosphate phosphatase [Oscillospiraceae bacterium]MBQ3560747.1 undecaprenyl-diphosphate phosphatase [Oscillospiraceae bacterium]MBQ6699891.1 undecaprenyl-diphosphate phosphatase [Oscillospiraceae bacterium]